MLILWCARWKEVENRTIHNDVHSGFMAVLIELDGVVAALRAENARESNIKQPKNSQVKSGLGWSSV